MAKSTLEFETVLLRKDARVATVTLNRPASLNAMNLRMHEELSSVWDSIEVDDDIWVVVVRGSGGRAFCVGQDLKERAELDERGSSGHPSIGSFGQPGWPRLTERFGFTKPLIAAVDGFALGGGFELALACDLIIATDKSSFGLPEVKLGLIPGAGGIFRLARQLPPRLAAEILLTGETIDARRAFDLGLINCVASEGRFEEIVAEYAAKICRSAPLSVRSIKDLISRTDHLSLEMAFSVRSPVEEQRRTSLDAIEGVAAFATGREPSWTGR